MSLKPVDVAMVVKYDFKDPTQNCIYTNARTEALEELFSNWMQDQMFKGGKQGDQGKQFEDRDVYTIKIGLFLEDDCFATESDTGNLGLTVGIIMDVLTGIHKNVIAIKTLEELPK